MSCSRETVRFAFRSRIARSARCFPPRSAPARDHGEPLAGRGGGSPSRAASDATTVCRWQSSGENETKSGRRFPDFASVVGSQSAPAIAKNSRYGSMSASRRRPSRPGGVAVHSPCLRFTIAHGDSPRPDVPRPGRTLAVEAAQSLEVLLPLRVAGGRRFHRGCWRRSGVSIRRIQSSLTVRCNVIRTFRPRRTRSRRRRLRASRVSRSSQSSCSLRRALSGESTCAWRMRVCMRRAWWFISCSFLVDVSERPQWTACRLLVTLASGKEPVAAHAGGHARTRARPTCVARPDGGRALPRREEERAHGGTERAVAADGERGTAGDRAGEVAELHRRGPEARHGRSDLGRRRECERARDEGAAAGDDGRAREESRARRDARARRAEEAVRDREEDCEQDENRPRIATHEPTARSGCRRRRRPPRPRAGSPSAWWRSRTTRRRARPRRRAFPPRRRSRAAQTPASARACGLRGRRERARVAIVPGGCPAREATRIAAAHGGGKRQCQPPVAPAALAEELR